MNPVDAIIVTVVAAIAFFFGLLIARTLAAGGLGPGATALIFAIALVIGLVIGALRDILNTAVFRRLGWVAKTSRKNGTEAGLRRAVQIAMVAGLATAYLVTRVWSPDALLSWL